MTKPEPHSQTAVDAMVKVVSTSIRPRPGDYAELLDENDENGLVCLRRAKGELVMALPRELYEKLRMTRIEPPAPPPPPNRRDRRAAKARSRTR